MLAVVLFISVTSYAEIAGKIVSVSGTVLARNEDSSATKMKILKSGDTLEAGYVINTSSNGSSKLLMTDKSIVDLGPSTLFKVNEYKLKNQSDRRVNMEMSYGKMRASVNIPVGAKGKFTIKTKAATMGVRGTEFVVLSDIDEFMAPVAAPAEAPTAKEAEKPAETAEAKPTPSRPKTQITVIQGKVEVTDNKAPQKKAVALTEGTQMTTQEAPARSTAASVGSEKTEPPKIVKLSRAEVKAVQQEAKQEDKTFVQAIVVDRSDSSSKGEDTLLALSESFTLPADFVPSIGDMGLIGLFGSNFGIVYNQYAVDYAYAQNANVSVVFKK